MSLSKYKYIFVVLLTIGLGGYTIGFSGTPNMSIKDILASEDYALALSSNTKKPSDLIEQKAPGQIVALSGANPKIFKNLDMKLAPLGPPRFQANDLPLTVDFQKMAKDWLDIVPPLTPSI